MNIIHRDIKPENLLIKSKEEGFSSIKITDFGLARFIKTDETAVTTCGTPGYIAPEIINLSPYGKECDFWSVGVVLYIMLSGSPPFYEDDKEGLFDKIRKGICILGGSAGKKTVFVGSRGCFLNDSFAISAGDKTKTGLFCAMYKKCETVV